MSRTGSLVGLLLCAGCLLGAQRATAQLPPPCEMGCHSKPDSLYEYPSKAEQRECRRLGKRDARQDIARDSLVHKFWGLPQSWDEVYARFMEKRYGVTVDFVAADLVCERATSYWNGYNSVSISEIESRFGEGVIDSTYQDAKEHYPSRDPLNYEVLKTARYTTEARRDSVEGRVFIQFGVLPSGIPCELEVIRGLGHGLDEEALEVVRKLRFEAAEDIERDTILWRMTVPVIFSLSQEE